MIPPEPEQVPAPVKSSARVKQTPKSGNLKYPEPGTSANHPEAGTFPEVPGVQWESKKTGVVEAWHCPKRPTRNRTGKRYIGQLGKKRMIQINTFAPGDAAEELRRWVIAKAKEKGIDL